MIFHQSNNSLCNYNYNIFRYTNETFNYHFHRNLELIYVIKGAVNCTVNNEPYRLTTGEFGLCLPYDVHRYVPEEETVYWVLVFSEDFIRFLSKRFSNKTGNGFKFHCKSSVENFIKEQLINDDTATILKLKSCLYAVLEEYLNNISLIDRSKKEAHIISVISDYVKEHHTEKLTLSNLAKKLGYDYNYMSRYFHNTFNISFSDFVNIYRLETATQLLEETNESICSIALKSGFQSVRSFNHFFKASTNTTPSQYKKTSRKRDAF